MKKFIFTIATVALMSMSTLAQQANPMQECRAQSHNPQRVSRGTLCFESVSTLTVPMDSAKLQNLASNECKAIQTTNHQGAFTNLRMAGVDGLHTISTADGYAINIYRCLYVQE